MVVFRPDSNPSMRKSLSQWLLRRPAVPAWASLQAACQQRGWVAKLTHEHDGFVVEAPAWRMEWGPAQRDYLGSHELRLRADIAVDPQLHALVMPRALMAQLEQALYRQFVESVQTRLDDETPEEVRWLAVSERLSSAQLGPLATDFGAVGNDSGWLTAWLGGPLSPALAAWRPADAGESEAPPAMALMLRRGQLVWRLALARPTASDLISAVKVFETAWHALTPTLDAAQAVDGAGGNAGRQGHGPAASTPGEPPAESGLSGSGAEPDA